MDGGFGYIGARAPFINTADILNNAITAYKESNDPWTNIASAATADLGAVNKRNLNLTGVVTITSFGTAPAGTIRRVKTASALQITYNAVSMITPGAVNLVTVAGATFLAISLGSGNWQVFNYSNELTTSTSFPVSSKAVTYAMLTSDRGTEIIFTAGGVSLNLLAAASAGNGATVIVRNAAASGLVTIDPAGAETLDGLATRDLRPGDRVIIVCDGANWNTVAGDYYFTSGDLTITTGPYSLLLNVAHGLGGVPDRVRTYLRCTSAILGYSVGDIVDFTNSYYNGFEENNGQVVCSATNIKFFQCANGWRIGSFTTGTLNPAIDPTKWKLVVEAWRK